MGHIPASVSDPAAGEKSKFAINLRAFRGLARQPGRASPSPGSHLDVQQAQDTHHSSQQLRGRPFLQKASAQQQERCTGRQLCVPRPVSATVQRAWDPHRGAGSLEQWGEGVCRLMSRATRQPQTTGDTMSGARQEGDLFSFRSLPVTSQ